MHLKTTFFILVLSDLLCREPPAPLSKVPAAPEEEAAPEDEGSATCEAGVNTAAAPSVEGTRDEGRN